MRSDIATELIARVILILIGSFAISFSSGFPFWKVFLVACGASLIVDSMKDGV